MGDHLRTHTEDRTAGALLIEIARGMNQPRTATEGTVLEVRLYFDGGSRGNPGITGAGSVILERHREGWTVVWWTAHFMGDQSTNNEAEHEALRRGAEALCRRYKDSTIHATIIGDSQLVLRHVVVASEVY
jgi:hypothetical protein